MGGERACAPEHVRLRAFAAQLTVLSSVWTWPYQIAVMCVVEGDQMKTKSRKACLLLFEQLSWLWRWTRLALSTARRIKEGSQRSWNRKEKEDRIKKTLAPCYGQI